MITINLIDLDKSDVKYEKSTFPDGEPHIKINPIDRKETYNVITRISNPVELFLTLQVGDILKRQGVIFDLTISYLMSMRMDRVVNFEESFTLNLVAQMINSLNARKVYIYEAHSERTFDLINNSEPYIAEKKPIYDRPTNEKTIVCYPDHGAFERYGNKYEKYILLNKKRDLENKGKIVSMEIEDSPEKDEDVGDMIVIKDDLCDAGGTFCWAAKILRETYPGRKIAIDLTHIVNPVGLKNLAENFDEVWITNSYKDWDISEYPNVTLFKIF